MVRSQPELAGSLRKVRYNSETPTATDAYRMGESQEWTCVRLTKEWGHVYHRLRIWCK